MIEMQFPIHYKSSQDTEWLNFIKEIFSSSNVSLMKRNAILFIKQESSSLEIGYIGSFKRNTFVITKNLTDATISLSASGLKITGIYNDKLTTYLISILNEEYDNKLNELIEQKQSDEEIIDFIETSINQHNIFESIVRL